MNKTYHVICATDQLQASKLSLIRTWLRYYFSEHQSDTSINIQHEFHEFLQDMYRKDFYDVFSEPNKYKFVHLDKVDKSSNDLPRFSMHKWMYSTFIRRPLSTINCEKTGVGKV